MRPEEFNKIFEDTIQRCFKMLNKKEREYSANNDRLVQFKIAGALNMTNPVEALAGMMIKHTTKLYMMSKSYSSFTLDEWDEVIIDHINYLILLRAFFYPLRSSPIKKDDMAKSEVKE